MGFRLRAVRIVGERGFGAVDATVAMFVIVLALATVSWSANRARAMVAAAESAHTASAELAAQLDGLRTGVLGQTDGWEPLPGGLQVRRTLHDEGIWLVEVRVVDRTGRVVAGFSGWELARP